MPPLSLIYDEMETLQRAQWERHCFSFKVISDGSGKLQSAGEVSNERRLLLCGFILHSILEIQMLTEDGLIFCL